MARKIYIETLKKRSDFLATAASGKKWVAPGLILQIRKCPIAEPETKEASKKEQKGKTANEPILRFGLTASKRVGGAVERNRAKRRLRALANEILAESGTPAYDYVLVARPATVTRAFADLRGDLITALKRLNAWQDG